jgi:hypothetical protein
MRMHHTPSHWILVVLVLVALLFVLSEAHGQGASANAVFEGRPAMAGAQGGLGAQAGPPQGGLGVQGNEAAERTMHLRRPSDATAPTTANDTTPAAAAATTDVAVARAADHKAAPRDTGVARDNRSLARKTRRAIRHTVRQARTGTPQIDSTTATGR